MRSAPSSGIEGRRRSSGLALRAPSPARRCAASSHPRRRARSFRVVPADYVTMDTGTGLVHTAPGHGEDDFRTGQRESLPILSPVDEGGRFTTVAKYQGKKVLDANPEIVEDLRPPARSSRRRPRFRHDYPHCWRCKKPVIFRATVQWFVRLDDPKTDVRGRALEAIRGRRSGSRPGASSASPAWSRTATNGSSRGSASGAPRSRSSTRSQDGERGATSTPGRTTRPSSASSSTTSPSIFREEGGDAWFARRPRTSCRQGADRRGVASFEKETDILDVWFDSGVSHHGRPAPRRVAGARARAATARRPTSTSRGTTSTAAGSSPRS